MPAIGLQTMLRGMQSLFRTVIENIGLHERIRVPTVSSTRYIDDGIGLPVPAGPYDNPTADMANFLVEVDYERVKVICERYLNQHLDGKIKYVPFLSIVLMTYAELLGYATDDKGQRMGLLPEKDLVFWVPTIAFKSWHGIMMPDHLAFFPFRLYVDSAYGLCAGREALGFNKTFASFVGPEQISRPQLEMRVLGFKEFDPNVEGKEDLLVKITGEKSSKQLWDRGSQAGKAIGEILYGEGKRYLIPGVVEKAIDLYTMIKNPESSSVSLKQFRAIEHPDQACYQKVIEAPTDVTAFYGGGFIEPGYELFINELASHPIARELGISLTQGKQSLGRGFWVKSAFRMDNGRVIS